MFTNDLEYLTYDNFEKESLKPLNPKPIIHTCKDGRKVCLNYHNPYGKNIPKMSNSHLMNTITFIKRNADKGITITYGGGFDPDDIWFDQETIYGKEAEYKMGLYKYLDEAKNRKLI